MIRRQFSMMTQKVFRATCQKCQPELHRANNEHADPIPVTFPVFNEWVQTFATEPKVVAFRKLAEECAMHIMDPAGRPAPSLDYTGELPVGLTATKLLEIYDKLWSL
mmetsp:Transcript_1540/g.2513  ORF Transcript_1540/g.2513 Transcript_1540/m.2513 type:complete len:107 (+) Transcript_1540:190-510(+)